MSEKLSEIAAEVRECARRIEESGSPALAGLYDLTAQRLLRYAVTITRNQHDAEDALQAALVKVTAAPECLANADQPWLYLLRMVRNEALLILRRKRTLFSVASIADLVCQTRVDDVEFEEQFQAVWKALRKLPRSQSEVVVLKIWEQLTFAEIGETLQITTSTAASRYRYAIQKLAVKLRDYVPGATESFESAKKLGANQ